MEYYIGNQEIKDPDDPEIFKLLTKQEQKELLDWIYNNFIPIQSFNNTVSSYSIKQRFSRLHFYIYNGVFKGAMLKAGYKVKNYDDKNWIFNISKSSKFFSIK